MTSSIRLWNERDIHHKSSEEDDEVKLPKQKGKCNFMVRSTLPFDELSVI